MYQPLTAKAAVLHQTRKTAGRCSKHCGEPFLGVRHSGSRYRRAVIDLRWTTWAATGHRSTGMPLWVRHWTRSTGAETSVAFRFAKERDFRGAKGDNPTVIDPPVRSPPAAYWYTSDRLGKAQRQSPCMMFILVERSLSIWQSGNSATASTGPGLAAFAR